MQPEDRNAPPPAPPPPPTLRERVVELLRTARTAPRAGTTRHERLVERCVAEHLRHPADFPVEVVVLDQLARGAAHRRTRPVPSEELPGA